MGTEDEKQADETPREAEAPTTEMRVLTDGEIIQRAMAIFYDRRYTVEQLMTEYCVYCLKRYEGSVSRASQFLGVGRTTLYRWIRDDRVVRE